MSQLQVTGEAKIRDIQGPVVANSGVITALDGAASQYVRGDGTLADFPSSSGGGSSVSYYLNSSVSQGTIDGNAYRELSKEPIIGTGTDIAISSNGYVANYITDANDPDVILLPGGNFNCEFYFSVNNNTGSPTTYAELYKYDGSTFTLLGSSSGVPESINQGTTIAPYYFAIPVATATLATTDRLAIRIYVNVDGRTVTLHTENSHLCQVVTTLSKGMVSLNNLTDQSQYLTTGTSGTNFAIVSSGDTHTFNLPVASATNTGKLSSTDWTTFNNKQNAITDPITGTGTSTGVAYFNSGTSITSEAAFNYDASTNRLGVNTSVPNATIGANAGTDSGYSLLLKNDNTNYNSIGFATDSTYGNMISADRTGSAPSRNLTLYNYAGFVSLTEAGNLGVGILNPTTGVDIYNSTNAQLWLHNDASGLGAGNGLRLALFSSKNGNISNFDGPMSISSEGDFQVITLGAENIRVNSVDGKVGIGAPATVSEMLTVNGSIQQAGVLSSMLKTNGDGKIIAAVAGTDYVAPSSLSGYVPTSRTITINGTPYDLSADRSWSVGTITGSGADGRVPYFNGASSISYDSGFVYDATMNRFGVNTVSPNATIGANAGTDSGFSLLLKNADTNYNYIGFATDSTYGNMIQADRLGTAPSRNLTLYNYAGFISLTEAGNLGVGLLTPNTGVDIYHSTTSSLWLHNQATGVSSTDGVRLALFNSKEANLRNYDGALSMSSEGDFSVITLGAENIRVNSANGYVGIGNPSIVLALLHVYRAESAADLLVQTNSITDYAEIAGRNYNSVSTTYYRQYSSGATGTDFGLSRSNLAALFSNYASNFAIGTQNGGDLILGTANTERMRILASGNIGIGTASNISASLTIYSATEANQFKLAGAAPAVVYADSLSTPSYVAVAGLTTAVNNFVNGSVVGDFVIANQKNYSILFATGSSTSIKMKLTSAGDLGIGTTSPDTKLDVRGEISLSYSADSGLRFYNQERSNWSSISNTITTGSSDTNLVFRTAAGVALTIAGTRDATFTTNISAQAATFSSSVLINGTSGGNAISSLNVKTDGTKILAIEAIAPSGNKSIYIKPVDSGIHLISSNYLSSGPYLSLALSARENTSDFVLTNSGNVGIGTSSPVRFEVVGNADLTQGYFKALNATTSRVILEASTPENSGNISLRSHSSNYGPETKYGINLANTTALTGNTGSNSKPFIIGVTNAADIVIGTNNTERMRITSGGKLCVQCTGTIFGSSRNRIDGVSNDGGQPALEVSNSSTTADGAPALACFKGSTTTNSDARFIQFYAGSGTTAMGGIVGNGVSNVQFAAISDVREKENILPISGSLEKILALNPVEFDWIKTKEHTNAGFIAQEVEEIFPEYVVENMSNKGEETRKGLTGGLTSGINVHLVKAIQELKAEIDQLKALIAAK